MLVMVVRKRRKKNKLRGKRHHGGGNTKNRRGAGGRGGVGRAGSHKHKFSKHYVDFGVSVVLKPKPKPLAVNLDFVSDKIKDWVSLGKVKVVDGFFVIDGKALGFGKILGKGFVSEKIRVVNCSVSKSAAEKIRKSGGDPGVSVEGAEGTGFDEEFEDEVVEESSGEES